MRKPCVRSLCIASIVYKINLEVKVRALYAKMIYILRMFKEYTYNHSFPLFLHLAIKRYMYMLNLKVGALYAKMMYILRTFKQYATVYSECLNF